MMPQADGMDMNVLMQRLRRLATLDTTVFDEVRTDPNATVPAIAVAIGSMLLAGIGGWLWWEVADFGQGGRVFVQSVIVGTILSFLVWLVWVLITYVMLAQVFRARGDLYELARVMGFALAPLALTLLMFIPEVDFGIGLTALALVFGTTLIAVQSATDAPAGRVLVAVGLGFAVWAIVLGLITTSSRTLAPGFFVVDRPIDALRDAIGAFG